MHFKTKLNLGQFPGPRPNSKYTYTVHDCFAEHVLGPETWTKAFFHVHGTRLLRRTRTCVHVHVLGPETWTKAFSFREELAPTVNRSSKPGPIHSKTWPKTSKSRTRLLRRPCRRLPRTSTRTSTRSCTRTRPHTRTRTRKLLRRTWAKTSKYTIVYTTASQNTYTAKGLLPRTSTRSCTRLLRRTRTRPHTRTRTWPRNQAQDCFAEHVHGQRPSSTYKYTAKGLQLQGGACSDLKSQNKTRPNPQHFLDQDLSRTRLLRRPCRRLHVHDRSSGLVKPNLSCDCSA